MVLEDGHHGRAAVPSGASTGAHEAHELSDGGARYGGKGVKKAVEAVNGEIRTSARGLRRRPTSAGSISLARSRRHGEQEAARRQRHPRRVACRRQGGGGLAGLPLYRYVGGAEATLLPVPMMNIINGGVHADNPIDFQEFMIAPVGAAEHRRGGAHGGGNLPCAQARAERRGPQHQCRRRGRLRPQSRLGAGGARLRHGGDQAAGYRPGKDIFIALDPAATEFYGEDRYFLKGEKRSLTAEQITAYYGELLLELSIFSIEDGMAEDDWEGWRALTEAFGDRSAGRRRSFRHQCHPAETKASIRASPTPSWSRSTRSARLTETLDAVRMAQEADYAAVMSHRSGETEDATIADLAVATNCGQIKTGSLARSTVWRNTTSSSASRRSWGQRSPLCRACGAEAGR